MAEHDRLYKVPVSLNRSYLDHEMNLSHKDWQIPPIPAKAVLFWVGSILTFAWVVTSTFMKDSVGWCVLLGIWWLMATWLMGRWSKTKELTVSSIMPLIEYLPKSARRVVTRTHSDPNPFYSIVGIKAIDPDGLITFADGTVGRGYHVVGGASILVFDADRDRIIDRVDNFYRKLDFKTEYITITTKEPQRVYSQLANLERRNRALTHRDPELFELMLEQKDVLADYVGKRFKSVHQYMILKSHDMETLRDAERILKSEVGQSDLMIKRCTQLNSEDVCDVLGVLFRGR